MHISATLPLNADCKLNIFYAVQKSEGSSTSVFVLCLHPWLESLFDVTDNFQFGITKCL